MRPMDQLRTNGLIGRDVVRVDGLLKVTGQAVYGADQPAGGPLMLLLLPRRLRVVALSRLMMPQLKTLSEFATS